ncbi:MAG TPA: DUF364 domain-containing protein [Desulfomonilaceae bacterium]|nr:DUF364 domain-containing protein [Desulfomonilaceae bacterium]
MSVRRKIRSFLQEQCGNVLATDVRIGLGYTAVQLEDGRTGVAYTFRDTAFSGCSVFRGLRPVAGKPAAQLLDLIESQDKLESSLGLATANAVANQEPDSAIAGDVIEAIEILPSDRVGMVGFFGPLIPALEHRVRHLEIFEEAPDIVANLLPAAEALRRLPECDVALITSTTIINNTTDALLEAASHCREVVLLGSSTPLVPKAFQDTPVTCLSGMSVKDPAGILQVVSEGGGTRFFKPFATKWNIPVRSNSVQYRQGK